MQHDLDVRGLAAPEPLERILDTLASLPAGDSLHVIHWREPLLLYPALERLGWRYETTFDSASGDWHVRIRKAG